MIGLAREEIAKRVQWINDNQNTFFLWAPIIGFAVGGLIAYVSWKTNRKGNKCSLD